MTLSSATTTENTLSDTSLLFSSNILGVFMNPAVFEIAGFDLKTFRVIMVKFNVQPNYSGKVQLLWSKQS